MSWLNYFKQNRVDRRAVPWRRKLKVEARLEMPLIRSLKRFQVGESGDGRHLKASARLSGDKEYIEAIDLFIAEEQEHARLMARLLKRMGATLLESHWSDRVFISLRRALGLRTELMVLLVPEMIAKRYFRALHDGTKDPILRAVFDQICRDEDGHVAFHVDTLHRMLASQSIPLRMLTRLAWRCVFRAACLVVMLDHFSVLRACGVSPLTFWWDCGLIFDETSAGIFRRAPEAPVLGARLSVETV